MRKTAHTLQSRKPWPRPRLYPMFGLSVGYQHPMVDLPWLPASRLPPSTKSTTTCPLMPQQGGGARLDRLHNTTAMEWEWNRGGFKGFIPFYLLILTPSTITNTHRQTFHPTPISQHFDLGISMTGYRLMAVTNMARGSRLRQEPSESELITLPPPLWHPGAEPEHVYGDLG